MTNRQHNKGRLTVIYGPMFSGKTGKLVSMEEVLTRIGRSVTILKPSIDTRYTEDPVIASHDAKRARALDIHPSLSEEQFVMLSRIRPDVIVIDEAQFFNTDRILELTVRWLAKGIDVIASGLLYDYRRRPFGVMPILLGISHDRVEMTAVCEKCGGVARQSERTGGSAKLVDVGAADKYIAVCGDCHKMYQEGN